MGEDHFYFRLHKFLSYSKIEALIWPFVHYSFMAFDSINSRRAD